MEQHKYIQLPIQTVNNNCITIIAADLFKWHFVSVVLIKQTSGTTKPCLVFN